MKDISLDQIYKGVHKNEEVLSKEQLDKLNRIKKDWDLNVNINLGKDVE